MWRDLQRRRRRWCRHKIDWWGYCRRQELHEEAGLVVQDVYDLGAHYPDCGRLENKIHSFLVTATSDPAFVPEPDVEPHFVTWQELLNMVKQGDFATALHISTLFLAVNHPQFPLFNKN